MSHIMHACASPYGPTLELLMGVVGVRLAGEGTIQQVAILQMYSLKTFMTVPN
jgi:hypothetical protein